VGFSAEQPNPKKSNTQTTNVFIKKNFVLNGYYYYRIPLGITIDVPVCAPVGQAGLNSGK
jgi:hypothetical protein